MYNLGHGRCFNIHIHMLESPHTNRFSTKNWTISQLQRQHSAQCIYPPHQSVIGTVSLTRAHCTVNSSGVARNFRRGASICRIPLCAFPFSCPTPRPITLRNHIPKKLCIFLTGCVRPLYNYATAHTHTYWTNCSPWITEVDDRTQQQSWGRDTQESRKARVRELTDLYSDHLVTSQTPRITVHMTTNIRCDHKMAHSLTVIHRVTVT